jgi:Na+/glutamate symporter
MKDTSNDKLLWKYAGLATQLFIAIGISVYVGIKLDKLFSFSIPVFVWCLPLLVIGALIYKVIKDTAPKK